LLKVIIADDEKRVCQLILHLIDWQKMSMDIVAGGNDGETAYEKICELQPDIVITDIRMPNFDGLELIQKVREQNQNIYFIIISGYSHFEYAHKAIKFGVEDYLVKPLKKKELIAALQRITNKIQYARSSAIEKHDLMSALDKSSEKAKNNLLYEILLNRFNLNGVSKSTINEQYYCHFKFDHYLITVLRPFIKPNNGNTDFNLLLLNKLQLLIKNRFVELDSEVITSIWGNDVVCLIELENKSTSAIQSCLRKTLSDSYSLRSIFGEYHLRIGIGGVIDSLEQIMKSYREARIVLYEQMIFPDKQLMEYDETSMGVTRDVEEIIDQDIRNRLHYCIEYHDKDSLIQVITEVLDRLNSSQTNGNTAYSCYEELVEVIVFSAKNYILDYTFPNTDYLINKYNEMLKMEDAYKWLSSEIVSILNEYLKNKHFKESKPIRLAKQYININFAQTISLDIVSELVGLNPAYFSSVFKKQTGENFSDYVINVRIENAKSIILNTNKDLIDVAMSVGYNDAKYFSKVFKKSTGLSPSKFRRLYQ